MLLAWMTYAVLVAFLATVAALAVERLVPRRARWAWAGALALGWAVPLVRVALERWIRSDAGVSVVLGPMAPVMDAALNNLGMVAGSAAAARLDIPLAALWAGTSALLLLVVAVGWLRLRHQARLWTAGDMGGTQVLVSDDVGPAVVGVLRPRIVVPRWVAELPAEERHLILAHEEEHRRKRDPALLAAALLMSLLTPWNPFLWLAFFRLRNAVEVDCDARVLAGGAGSPQGYAELLFQVGTMPGRPVPLGAGFGERTSSLERRIRAMLEERTKGRAGAVSLRVALAAGLILVACSLEVNIDLGKSGDDGVPASPPTVEAPQVAVEEVVIPPPPAVEPPKATGEKVVLPPPSSQTRSRAELEARPTFTPFTVAPTILNRDEVIEAMEGSYPPLLREAGVGGTVRVYFFIDETGRVSKTLIDTSSGHPALDDAAMHVASIYRFEPALNRGDKVPVWVSFPITFQVR